MKLIHLCTNPDVGQSGIEPGPEGFIHLCTEDQVEAVIARFFATTEVVEAWVDRSSLEAEKLRFEDTYGHGAFPHYYDVIPGSAVAEIRIRKPSKAD